MCHFKQTGLFLTCLTGKTELREYDRMDSMMYVNDWMSNSPSAGGASCAGAAGWSSVGAAGDFSGSTVDSPGPSAGASAGDSVLPPPQRDSEKHWVHTVHPYAKAIHSRKQVTNLANIIHFFLENLCLCFFFRKNLFLSLCFKWDRLNRNILCTRTHNQ